MIIVPFRPNQHPQRAIVAPKGFSRDSWCHVTSFFGQIAMSGLPFLRGFRRGERSSLVDTRSVGRFEADIEP